MSRYRARTSTPHQAVQSTPASSDKTGVLIANLGTPDAPTAKALRRYLAEFLSDPRVVEIPRLLWLCILYGIILITRPAKSAKLYQKIWTDEGSPLLAISRRQQRKIQTLLGERAEVKLGMRYGTPSITCALREFQQQGINKIVVLPLYPQYGGPTTASVFDAVMDEIKQWRFIPELHFINSYYRDEGYLNALAASIAEQLDPHNLPERLLLSYHGMPKLFFKNGDPYYCHSLGTSKRLLPILQKKLEITDKQRQQLDWDSWLITCFQSRFGKAEWLQPYTDGTLEDLAQSGVKNVAIACPAFSVDCLETLEEIAEENRDIFLTAGGERYQYIPCLNDRDDHIEALVGLITPYLNK